MTITQIVLFVEENIPNIHHIDPFIHDSQTGRQTLLDAEWNPFVKVARWYFLVLVQK